MYIFHIPAIASGESTEKTKKKELREIMFIFVYTRYNIKSQPGTERSRCM